MSVLEYTSRFFVFQGAHDRSQQPSRRFLLARIFYPFSSLLGCWHRSMSRPFTRDGRSYCVCLNCGRRRNFSLDSWRMTGPYYFVNDLTAVLEDSKSGAIKKVPSIKREKSKAVSNPPTVQSWHSKKKGRQR